MSRFLLLAVCALFFFGCTAPLPQQQVRPDQLDFPPLEFSFPQVESQQLENGMRVFLKEDHELPLVEMTLVIGGGSIYDPLDQTGLSALFAAALETGGAGDRSPGELEAELESMAVDLSVSSGTYNYSIDLSFHQRDFSSVIGILADLLRRPGFDPQRLELARKQLLESIRRKNDDPGEVASRLLAEAVYPEHPFGATPDAEKVKAFSRDDLLRLQQRCLQPGNIWIAVSGAVSQSQLINGLEQNFGDWLSASMSDHALPPLPDTRPGRVLVADKDIPQTSIMLGHSGISKDNPDLFALRVANYILGGGGFNSRMMREIRSNRGLAYSVYSYFDVGRRLPGMFIAGSETKSESTVEVVALMRQLMQQLRDEPVSEDELNLARQSLINSFVFAFSDTHSIVSRKVRLDFFDYPDDYLETYREKIASVSVADVQRVARKYLRPEQLQIVLVGDRQLIGTALERLDMPIEQVKL